MSLEILLPSTFAYLLESSNHLIRPNQTKVFIEEQTTSIAAAFFKNGGILCLGITSGLLLYQAVHREVIEWQFFYPLLLSPIYFGFYLCFRDSHQTNRITFPFSESSQGQLTVLRGSHPLEGNLLRVRLSEVREGSFLLRMRHNGRERNFREQTHNLQREKVIRSVAWFFIGASTMYGLKIPHSLDRNVRLFEGSITFIFLVFSMAIVLIRHKNIHGELYQEPVLFNSDRVNVVAESAILNI